jgi:enoyl-CoA hydratase
MTMPRVAAAMLHHRLTPAAYQRAVTLAEYFDVEKARKVGFFDELAEPADLTVRANTLARTFGDLDAEAHRRSKRQVRSALIWQLRRSVPLDLLSAIRQGMR